MSKTYQIGQVLYIVSQTAKKVIPVQVQEIHRKQTIEGEEIVYMVMDPEQTGPHDLSGIDGEIYTSPKEVSGFLKNAAGKSIDQMVDYASNVAEEIFGVEKPSVFKAPAGKKAKAQPPRVPLPPKTGGMSRKEEKVEGMLEATDMEGNPKQLKVRSVQMPDESPKAV